MDFAACCARKRPRRVQIYVCSVLRSPHKRLELNGGTALQEKAAAISRIFMEDQCLLSKITKIPVETPTFFIFLHVFCVFGWFIPSFLWNLQGVSAAAGRHGTTWNLAKKWQGQQDTELAPEGIQQAEETGKLLASRSCDGKVAMDLWLEGLNMA